MESHPVENCPLSVSEISAKLVAALRTAVPELKKQYPGIAGLYPARDMRAASEWPWCVVINYDPEAAACTAFPQFLESIVAAPIPNVPKTPMHWVAKGTKMVTDAMPADLDETILMPQEDADAINDILGDEKATALLVAAGATCVTGSPVRVVGGRAVVCPCIVVYVSNKGILPFARPLLPSEVTAPSGKKIPVDVRTGEFTG